MTVTYNGSCHCGAVEFEATVDKEITEARHCDCSICRRKTAFVSSALQGGFRITKGADNLTLYQFNTKVAEHYFCKTCGIYTHHKRRSNPKEYGFNIGCVEDLYPFDFAPAKVNDGINHPSDQ